MGSLVGVLGILGLLVSVGLWFMFIWYATIRVIGVSSWVKVLLSLVSAVLCVIGCVGMFYVVDWMYRLVMMGNPLIIFGVVFSILIAGLFLLVDYKLG